MKAVLIAVLIVAAAFAANMAVAQPQNTIDGATLYRNNCAACHGLVGEGDGPVASAMRVTVPNLRTLASRNSGEFPREAVAAYVDGRSVPAAHGDRQMPVWGEDFGTDDDPDHSDATVARRIGALLEFLNLLQYRD